MIDITRNDTCVYVRIEDGPLNSIYSFSYDCGNKLYAELLYKHFQKNLWDRIEAIRKIEYERGYKDGRAKKAKKSWFFSSMTTNKYNE